MENTRVVAFDNAIVWIIVPVVVALRGKKKKRRAWNLRRRRIALRTHADV